MPRKIVWKDQAKAQLRAIDQPTALRILHALARLIAAGEGDVKRLQEIEPPEFRLRVGDYRIFCAFIEAKRRASTRLPCSVDSQRENGHRRW